MIESKVFGPTASKIILAEINAFFSNKHKKTAAENLDEHLFSRAFEHFCNVCNNDKRSEIKAEPYLLY